VNIWELLSSIEGKIIKTLSQKKPFYISTVESDKLTIIPYSTGKERKIKRSTIENTFSELIFQSELSRAEIRQNFSEFNPAYVAALLAEHPAVKYKLRPIVLYYEK
jgi:hypothetical protein